VGGINRYPGLHPVALDHVGKPGLGAHRAEVRALMAAVVLVAGMVALPGFRGTGTRGSSLSKLLA
jgi:hypothetical protein